MGGHFYLRRLCAYPGCNGDGCYRTIDKGTDALGGGTSYRDQMWCQTCEVAYSHCTECNGNGCTKYNCATGGA